MIRRHKRALYNSFQKGCHSFPTSTPFLKTGARVDNVNETLHLLFPARVDNVNEIFHLLFPARVDNVNEILHLLFLARVDKVNETLHIDVVTLLLEARFGHDSGLDDLPHGITSHPVTLHTISHSTQSKN